MTRQRNEDCAVPKGRRKAVQTHDVERRGGGKAIPVNERACQLELRIETAEKPARATDGGVGRHHRKSAPREVPKSTPEVSKQVREVSKSTGRMLQSTHFVSRMR